MCERGELVLRRREGGALELRVNGVFVMDDAETSSEELLASAALDAVLRPARVLVGGLGLGYTVRALLADARVESVLVAEIEPAVVQWMRDGLVPSVLDDARVRVEVGDVRDVVLAQRVGVGGRAAAGCGQWAGFPCLQREFGVVREWLPG